MGVFKQSIVKTALITTLGLTTAISANADLAINRADQAKELLGKYYQRSVVRHAETVEAQDIKSYLRKIVKNAMNRKWETSAYRTFRAIMRESKRYQFDPLFLFAVIENESSFNPNAIGGVGEIGLMQVTPATGEWIAKKYNIKWRGKHALKNPVYNIRVGAAYLDHLRKKYDSHSRLYLAAYNMGPKNLRRLRSKNDWPVTYPLRVMKRYLRLYTEWHKAQFTVAN